jgi:hypothetical protein
MRHAAMTLLAVLALAGCDSQKTRDLKDFAYVDAVMAPKIPMRFALSTPDAKVELVLPPLIDRYPELHAKLYDDGKQELTEFLDHAVEDRKRYAAKGVSQPTPYERRVVWTITAITPHLISLRSAWSDDTGAAHPDHGSDVLLWDRLHNVILLPSELFKPDIDHAQLDDLLCQAVTRAKQARIGPTDPKSWSCPTWESSHAVLVPSTTPYRAGGLMFLFDPYTIGAYAEGDYDVLIPLSAFKSAIAPAWAADFAGSPAPTVKARP